MGGYFPSATGDFSGLAVITLPADDAPVVDSVGEFALDTLVTGYTGMLTYHDGNEALFVVAMPIANLITTDGFVVAYNATNDEFEMVGPGGGALTAIVQDLTPQLGGDLDANTFDILFDSTTGIRDESDNEQIIFITTGSAINYIQITNAAVGNDPDIAVEGDDTNIGLSITPKGTGVIAITGRLAIPASAAPTTSAGGEIAVDTTITDHTGLIQYNDGTESLYVIALPTANLLNTDGFVIAYNATNNEFEMVAPAGGALTAIVQDLTPQLGGDLDANTFDILFDSTTGIRDESDNEQIIFITTGSAINYIQITNAAASNDPDIAVEGGDTNIGLSLTPKGTGAISISSINYPTADGAANTYMTSDGAGTLSLNSLDIVDDTTPQLGGDLDANLFDILFDTATGIRDDTDNEQLIFIRVATAINYIQITNSAVGNDPDLAVEGDDTNIGLSLTPKGTGAVSISAINYPTADGAANTYMTTDGAGTLSLNALNIVDDTTPQLGGDLDANLFDILFDTATGIRDNTDNEQLIFIRIASAINYLQITNADIGNDPDFAAAGDDTNIGISITPKGSGAVSISGINYPTADGAANTYLTSDGAGTLSLNALNIVDDTTPQLGGDLDANTFDILFDSTTGIRDESDNEQLIFITTASAINHIQITNAAIGTDPDIAAVGGDTDIGLSITPKGTGIITITGKLAIPASAAPSVAAGGEIAVDTTITDHTGLILYHDGTEALFVIALPTANLTADDGFVIAYNAANNEFEMAAPAGGALTAIVQDTSPQLGGDLDANTFDILFDSTTGIRDESDNEQIIFITTASAINHIQITNAAAGGNPEIAAVGDDTDIGLVLTPKGTDAVIIDGLSYPTADGAANTYLTSDGAGTLSLNALNIVDDTTPQLGGNLDANGNDILIDTTNGIRDELGNEQLIFITTGSAINFIQIANAAMGSPPLLAVEGDDTNIGLSLVPKGSGAVSISGINYPTADGAANTYMTTDGAGTLSLNALDIIDDTTPQLGGDLDANLFDILFDTGTGIRDNSDNEQLIFIPALTAINHLQITNAAIGNNPDIAAIGDDTNVGFSLTPKGAGAISISAIFYPTADGAANAYMKTDGAATLSLTALNIVDDTTPQLGGDLDTNTFDILFDSTTGIRDESDNEQIIFITTGSAINHIQVTNAAIGNDPDIAAVGGDTDIGLSITPKGTGIITITGKLAIPASAAPSVAAGGEIAVDTTITDHTGLILYHDGTEALFVIALPTANLISTDGFVIAYNATNDEFEMVGPGGGALTAIVQDTSPQLGGDLDANTFDILFDSTTGIRDESDNEQIIFITTGSAINHIQITNAAAGGNPEIAAVGDDTDIGLVLTPKGSDAVIIDGLSYPTADGAANEVLITSGSAVLSFTAVTPLVSNASLTVAGKIEIADVTETNTGTDATRAVSPDGLAGSIYGTKIIVIKAIANDTALIVANNLNNNRFVIPIELNGMNLISVGGHVFTVSSSGLPTFQVRNNTDAVDMLTTPISIDVSELDSKDAAAPPVIDAANDDVVTGDELQIDSDIAGTGTLGCEIRLGFRTP